MKKIKFAFIALLFVVFSLSVISCDGNLNNPGNASEENIPAVSEDDKTQINKMSQEEKESLAKKHIIDFITVIGNEMKNHPSENHLSFSGLKGEKGQYWGDFKYIEENETYPTDLTIKTNTLTFKLSFIGDDIFGGNSSASDVKINGEKVCGDDKDLQIKNREGD